MMNWEDMSNIEIQTQLKIMEQQHIKLKDDIAKLWDIMLKLEKEYNKGFDVYYNRTKINLNE